MHNYSLRPVNKNAALVTNQSGCSDVLTKRQKAEQQRDNLISKIENLKDRSAVLHQGSKKKWLLNKQIRDSQDKLQLLQMKIGKPEPKKRRLQEYILDAFKEALPRSQFEAIINKATLNHKLQIVPRFR